MAVDAAFSHQGQHLAHALERRRGEHVCSELHKVRQCGVFADHKQPLPEAFEQRTDLFQRRVRARGEHEQFPCFCEVRVTEHRRSDIILAMARMLLGDAGLGAAERHAEMLELDDRRDRLAAQVFDRVLVAEPVGTPDRSNMCQRQSSFSILPSAALMPPCAATV